MFNLPLWRDISVTLLAIELAVALAPICVLMFLCVKYVPQGIHWLEDTLRAIRRTVESFRRATQQVARRVIAPFIAIRQGAAAGRSMARAAFSFARRK